MKSCGTLIFFRDVKKSDRTDPDWQEKLWLSAEETSVVNEPWKSRVGENILWEVKSEDGNPYSSEKDDVGEKVRDYRRAQSISISSESSDAWGLLEQLDDVKSGATAPTEWTPTASTATASTASDVEVRSVSSD